MGMTTLLARKTAGCRPGGVPGWVAGATGGVAGGCCCGMGGAGLGAAASAGGKLTPAVGDPVSDGIRGASWAQTLPLNVSPSMRLAACDGNLRLKRCILTPHGSGVWATIAHVLST